MKLEIDNNPPAKISFIEADTLGALAQAHTESDHEFVSLLHIKRCAAEKYPISVLRESLHNLSAKTLVNLRDGDEFSLSLLGFSSMRKYPALFDSESRREFISKISNEDLLRAQIILFFIIHKNDCSSEEKIKSIFLRLCKDRYWSDQNLFPFALQALTISKAVEIHAKDSFSTRFNLNEI